MKQTFLAVLLAGLAALALAPTPTLATEYTYRDGYYWSGAKAYSRQKVYYPQTYSYRYCNGYYQQVADPLYYYYEYTQVPVYTPPTPTPAYTPTTAYQGWEQALLDLAKQRDSHEAAMRKTWLDHQRYLQAVNALGLTGNFNIPNYGSVPYPLSSPGPLKSTGYGNTSSYGTYGPVQGLTTYGYSVQQIRDIYGPDINGQMQMAGRLAQNAQQLSGQATADLHGLVGDAGDKAARIAEILAKGKAAETTLKATEPQPSSRTVTTTSGTATTSSSGGGLSITASAVSAPSQPVSQEFGNFLTARCTECHGGATPKGKLTLDAGTWPRLSLEQQLECKRRILSRDDKERMPPPPKPALPAVEQTLFLRN